MNRQMLFGLGAMLATCVSTMLAFAPISRFLSKIGGYEFTVAKGLFFSHVLPGIAAGLAMVVIALCLAPHKPVLALLFLAAAPIAVFGMDLTLMTLHL